MGVLVFGRVNLETGVLAVGVDVAVVLELVVDDAEGRATATTSLLAPKVLFELSTAIT
jgi:hypothetical protein